MISKTKSKIAGLMIPVAYIFIIFGIAVYFVKDNIADLYYFNINFVALTSVVFICYGLSVLLLSYLRGGDQPSSSTDENMKVVLKSMWNELEHNRHASNEVKENSEKIKIIEEALVELKENKYQIPPEEKDEILKNIREGVLSGATNSIVSEIESKYSESIQSANHLNRIQEQLGGMRLRLRREIAALGRRGNVNLVIGVITTVVAVLILVVTVWDSELQFTSETVVSHFIPRLTLSFFIEVFSFFFLRLYKSGLGEIKYFQNELTNIEMKFVSLESALRYKEEVSLSSVIDEFSKTERNFIINKDQSTIEIERNKLEVESGNTTLSSLIKLSDLLKK